MTTPDSAWPLPKFAFAVTGIPGNPVFQQVTGLESEAQVIEYRAGASSTFSTIKMPGIRKVGNVTMKKGIFVTDASLWTWFDAISMNAVQRSAIVINLLDETGVPRMRWTLQNAFPTKLSGTVLKSDGNEVAVETLEIAFETMTVAAA